MIESGQAASQTEYTTITKPKKVLRMRAHSRMGGSVPVWDRPSTAKETIAQTLDKAYSASDNKALPDQALALQNGGEVGQAKRENQEFGFGDLIDMVNPLHHIPVVGSAYRAITGDNIKPIGKIVGGGLFGGPLGVGGGLVNLVAEQETGRDLTGNAVHMIMGDNGPSRNAEAAARHGFTDTASPARYETQRFSGNNTAELSRSASHNAPAPAPTHTANTSIDTPNMRLRRDILEANYKTLPDREPITTFSMRKMKDL